MFQNLVHILMVLAIANPLCCCTMAGLPTADHESTTPAHCCGATDADATETAPESGSHNPEECPHQTQIDYPRTAQQEVKSADGYDALPTLLWVPLYSREIFPAAPAGLQIAPGTASPQGHAVAYAQLYCVYRI